MIGAFPIGFERERRGILPPSGLTELRFIGCVRAGRFKRDPYEVSITVECGGWFRREIFSVSGTVDEIEKEIVRFLLFVNPYKIMGIRSRRVADSALFK